MRRRSGDRLGARLGVRARLTLVTTVVLAVALGAAGVLAVVVARSALLASLDDAALQRGQEVAGLLEAGRLPDPVPVTGAAVVQVLDASGRVVGSSPGGDRLSPLLSGPPLATARDGTAVPLDGSRVGSPDPFRVLGVPAGQGRTSTVLVATSVAEVQRAAAVVTQAVLLAVPVLLVAMALVTWRVAGSALRPVERLLGRLDAAAARQRVFVADAAHELRSPLGSLRTQLEVALAHPDAQDWSTVARDGLTDVRRMSALVEDLLVLARMDDRASSAAPVDLRAVVHEATDRPRRRPVRVRDDLPPEGVAQVLGDRRALVRVVGNLLDNAARYAVTEVQVGLRLDGDDAVRVTVLDDGPGIPVADRERVFERFTRLDPARDRDAGGTGLGLAIVRAVAERHGGSALASSRADGRPGAELVVRLPIG